MLRGWVERFATVAANPEARLVERLRKPLPAAEERAHVLAAAMQGSESDPHETLQAVSTRMDRFLAGDPTVTAEQGYYLRSLANNPGHAILVYLRLPGGNSDYAEIQEESLLRMADGWMAFPELQHQPFFQHMLRREGVLAPLTAERDFPSFRGRDALPSVDGRLSWACAGIRSSMPSMATSLFASGAW
ncbi:MAG: hypothetical protein HY690_06950 [Chloroflexi bacterium]|nr:hypothetical protein [Chloroflexota bacterium]